MLVLHGTEDERAPMADMRRMEARMRALGKACTFVFYEAPPRLCRTHPPRLCRGCEKQSFDEAKRFPGEISPVTG